MKQAYLRFYEELNNYLPEAKRKQWIVYELSSDKTIRHVLAEFQIPSNEIDLLLVNQQSQNIGYQLKDQDRISVFPMFELFDISGISEVRNRPLRKTQFICDVHLGKLGKYLRMLGFDTLYSNQYSKKEIISIAENESRIILSKDRSFSKYPTVNRFYRVRSSNSLEQLKDLLDRMSLYRQFNPFSRCLRCNHPIKPIEKKEIQSRIQEQTQKYYDQFFICPNCDHVYWKGSHFESMRHFIEKSLKLKSNKKTINDEKDSDKS